MFNLRKFVKDTVDKMINEEPDYKIMELALNWYNKRVLQDEDLADIQNKIEEKNKSVEIEENTEINLDTLQKM